MAEIHKAVLPQFSLVVDFLIIKVRVTYFFAPLDFFLLMGHPLLFIWESGNLRQCNRFKKKPLKIHRYRAKLNILLRPTLCNLPQEVFTLMLLL